MTLRPIAFILALATTAAFAADANTFALTKDGKTIGRASYTIDTGKDGYHVKTRYEYHFAAAPSKDPTASTTGMLTEGQYTNDFKVDLNGNYISGYTQNAANQMMTSFQPDKTRTIITVNQAQAGNQLGGKTFPIPTKDFTVVPDYDPGSIQMLLTASIAHPHADSKYTLVVPGSGVGGKGSPTVVYIAIQPAPDATGTFDGKPLTLKHFMITFAKGKADIFLDPDGKLMQADMGTLSTSYIRTKFVLSGK